MTKRGSRCPDCDGPHGRGYYTCPTPYKNEPDVIEPILTQRELTIDLSAPAMKLIAGAIDRDHTLAPNSVQSEIDNFCNTLLNLIERGVDCASRRQPTDEELCS